MRSTQYSNTVQHGLYVVLLAALITCLVVPCLPAQGTGLQIEVLNLEQTTLADNVMYEGNQYTISVGISGGLPILQDVKITVPWTTFLTTNATPILEFTAPNYQDYPSFVISASKPGYESTNMTITVLRGALHMTTPSTSVREGGQITVSVMDQHGTSIADAKILMRGIPVATTDSMGQVVISAPEVSQDQEVVLAAAKDGYVTGTRTIVVSNVHSLLFTIDMSQIVPILVAVFILIFAVGLVRWRQTHRVTRTKGEDDDDGAPSVRVRTRSLPEEFSTPTHGPSKIEEIRIPTSERRRDTTVITTEKEHVQHHPPEKHLEYDQWFQGTDYAKFKLDSMTGKINKNKEGKWFDGEDNIETKVDEVLKKKTQPRKSGKHRE